MRMCVCQVWCINGVSRFKNYMLRCLQGPCVSETVRRTGWGALGKQIVVMRECWTKVASSSAFARKARHLVF